MRRNIIICFTILLSAVFFTSCSNKREFTCKDANTNIVEDVSEALGLKMTVEFYSDNIKFTVPDDNGYESFSIKIIDDDTFEIPKFQEGEQVDIDVNWYIPFIHTVWNIKNITIQRKILSTGEYVYLYYE